MNEEWKDIKGFEGYYQVSNLGRVRSLDRVVTYTNGKVHCHKGRLLKFSDNSFGYQQVHIHKDGKPYTLVVHRIVALHFVDGYAEGLEVNHKDEDKHNNRADNLEWCDHLYNSNYGTKTERLQKNRKGCLYDKKGKCLEVYKDGEKIGQYNGYNEVAEALGFSPEYVSQIANGRKHPHLEIKIVGSRYYKVGQYKDGVLVATYPSVSAAKRATKIHRDSIMNSAKNNTLFRGYQWKFL